MSEPDAGSLSPAVLAGQPGAGRLGPAAIAGEPGARRISPFLLLLVVLSFFLAFAGVSCNATATKSVIGSIEASQGVSGAEAAQVTACINALDGVNILTYSGWQLAFGKDPVIGSVPVACNQNNAAGADTSSANIGPQLLALLALVCIGLGLLLSIAGAFGLLAARSRAFATAVFAAGAGVLLILDHLHVHDVLVAKISSSEGSSVRGLDPASLFNINPGTGLVVAIVILALAVLYNIAALIVSPAPVATAVPDSPTPPPPERPSPREASPPPT